MDSFIKTRLEKKQIEQFVKTCLPKQEIQEITEIPDGNICSVYVIQTSNRQSIASEAPIFSEHCSKMVLKVGMTADVDCLRYEKGLFPTEYKVYQLLQDQGIPIPHILKADLSGSIIPAGCLLMEFVEGTAWNKISGELERNERAQLMNGLGKCFAQISRIKGDYFGYLKDGAQHRFQTHGESFSHMIENILADGIERGIDLPSREIETMLYKQRSLLDEIKEPRLVDFDLWAGNVFVKKQKGQAEIAGIIDFGHCFYGDAYAAFAAAVHLFEDVEKEPDFIRGYECVSGETFSFTSHDRIRLDWYRLYLTLLCAVETYRYEKNLAEKVRASQLRKVERLLQKLQSVW